MPFANAMASAAIAQLGGTPEQRIHAARILKNAVVGNPTNKENVLRLGAVPPLVEAAADFQSNPVLAEQAIAVLGSLSLLFSPDDVSTVAPVLVAALFASDPRPITAAARALKMLFLTNVDHARKLGPAVATPAVAGRLVMLLSGADEGIAEVVAVILAHSSVGVEQAKAYEQAGAVPVLAKLLHHSDHERFVEATLNAMTALARHDRHISHTFAQTFNIVNLVLPFIRSPVHSLRLSACRLLAVFHSVAQLSSGLDGDLTTVVVDLLNTDSIQLQVTAANTLTELVLGSEELQRTATEAEAIQKLGDIIKGPCRLAQENGCSLLTSVHFEETTPERVTGHPSEDNIALLAAALAAIAALCGEYDDAREKVVSAQILPYVIDSLSSPTPEVVLASAKCIRSLSRSVTVLRRDIASVKLGQMLLELLASDSRDICRVVSATLCNFVLDFSPVRREIIDKEGISTLVQTLRSDDNEVRRNVLWALKNVLFTADTVAKNAVMLTLGYESLHMLCSEKDPRVQELSLSVVRNLCCTGPRESHTKQLDTLFASAGGQLITLLSESLRTSLEHSELATQALYVVCNFASGTEEHKAHLIQSDIPQLILRWTWHRKEGVRVAAVWCAVNLSWREKSIARRRPAGCTRRMQNSSARSTPRQNRHGQGRVQGSSMQQSEAESRRPPVLDSNRLVLRSSVDGSSTAVCLQFVDSHPGLHQYGSEGDSHELESKPAETKPLGYEWRIRRLRELGYEERLRCLVDEDPHIEVQGRARAALEFFDCEDLRPLEYDPAVLLGYNSPLLASGISRSPPVLLRVADSDGSSGASSI